jgi:hypothetical protein
MGEGEEYDVLRSVASVTKYQALAQVQSFIYLEDIIWRVTQFKYLSGITRRITEEKDDQNQSHYVKHWQYQYSCMEVKYGL